MIVSAYLYETQRFYKNDPYNQIVQKHYADGERALAMMTSRMMETAVRPMFTQFVKSEADHRALNVKFEDFGANFDDTVLRLVHFLGVPASLLPTFMATAQKFNLARNKPQDAAHVTAGKYDKQPLIDLVLNNKELHNEFSTMRKLLRYG